MSLYFVQPEDEPFVKIGYAQNNVRQRVRDLQCGNHRKLYLLAIKPGNAKEEYALHQRFSKHYHQGEWFHLTREILRFIGPQMPKEPMDSVNFDREQRRPVKANGGQVGAPVKFDAKLQAKARKLLKLVEKRTLSKKDPKGKPIVVTRPVYSKIEIAAMCGISTGTLHTWISQQKK